MTASEAMKAQYRERCIDRLVELDGPLSIPNGVPIDRLEELSAKHRQVVERMSKRYVDAVLELIAADMRCEGYESSSRRFYQWILEVPE